nr:hypothetical protein 2 [Cardiobacteriales bacterium]
MNAKQKAKANAQANIKELKSHAHALAVLIDISVGNAAFFEKSTGMTLSEFRHQYQAMNKFCVDMNQKALRGQL